MGSDKQACSFVLICIFICLPISYGVSVGATYGMKKNPGPRDTPIFDANGTLIYEEFKSQVLVIALAFWPAYFLGCFMLIGLCVVFVSVVYMGHSDQKETENTEPTIDDTNITLESKNLIDIEIDSSTD